jgi:DNA repair protein RecN (Recombination protein N)
MSINPALQPQVEELESAVIQLEEIARGLSRYAEAIEDSPERLQEVEERLELLRRLKHKYGPTLEDVIRFADEAGNKLQALESQEERRCRLEGEHRELKIEAGELAERLSRARQEAAGRLAKLVNSELVELGMPWARFDINLTWEECPDGLPAYQGTYSFTQHGIDRVQFLASTNPGEPLRPLADIASGGETCRFMLALKSALRQADSVPTLVFDEIDAGIGGRNAYVVGKKLVVLAKGRQVICITHLPQIACFGDDHYRVIKDVSGPQAVVRLEHLSGDSRVEELAAMLGSDRERTMMESAEELLRRAREDEKVKLVAVFDERNR